MFCPNVNNVAMIGSLVIMQSPAFTIGGGDGDSYGYVEAVSSGRVDGSVVTCYDIWNGTETVMYYEDSATAKAAKDDGIKYSIVSDTEIAVDGAATFTDYAIKAVDGDYLDLAINAGVVSQAVLKVDSDTTVLYIDSTNNKGLAAPVIRLLITMVPTTP